MLNVNLLKKQNFILILKCKFLYQMFFRPKHRSRFASLVSLLIISIWRFGMGRLSHLKFYFSLFDFSIIVGVNVLSRIIIWVQPCHTSVERYYSATQTARSTRQISKYIVWKGILSKNKNDRNFRSCNTFLRWQAIFL